MRTTCALCGVRLRDRQCPACGWNGYAKTAESRPAPKGPPGPTLEDTARRGRIEHCDWCGAEVGTCDCTPRPAERERQDVTLWDGLFWAIGLISSLSLLYQLLGP